MLNIIIHPALLLESRLTSGLKLNEKFFNIRRDIKDEIKRFLIGFGMNLEILFI